MAVDILRYEMFVNHEIFKQIHILGDEFCDIQIQS